MSRTRNLTDFRIAFQRLVRRYDALYGPQIERLRLEYTKDQKDTLEARLEAHIREYKINALLDALNWRRNLTPEEGLPNIAPEVPVRSRQDSRILFMDYLGFQRDDHKPLLIVETKAAREKLPINEAPCLSEEEKREFVERFLGLPTNAPSTDVAPTRIVDWRNKLGEYIGSVFEQWKVYPRRAVLTNGDWMLLVLDPESFISKTPDSDQVLLFKNIEDSKSQEDIFRYLEYDKVRGLPSTLMVSELSSLDPQEVERLCHGLRVAWSVENQIHRRTPLLNVSPVVLLFCSERRSVRVEGAEKVFRLPAKRRQVKGHLKEVRDAAEELVSQVNTRLGRRFVPVSLSELAVSDSPPTSLLLEEAEHSWTLLTGDCPHFLTDVDAFETCPFHNWDTCQARGIDAQDRCSLPSVSPRALFPTGTPYHCAHRDMFSVKSLQVAASKGSLYGDFQPRNNEAFCRIYPFEERLCCFACAIRTICFEAKCLRQSRPCANKRRRHTS